MNITVCVSFVLCALVVNCARILVVVPTPSVSHQIPFRPLTQELARRGHDVIHVTTDLAFPKGQTPPSLTEIDIRYPSYDIWIKGIVGTVGNDNVKDQFKRLYRIAIPLFEAQMQIKEFKEIIYSGPKIDLMILEAWFRPLLVLTKLIDAPVILMSSFGRCHFNYETMGASSHLFLNPTNIRQRIYNLTWWEKLTEATNEMYREYLTIDLERRYDEMAKRILGDDSPSMKELSNRVDMLFLNMHPIWEDNTPVPPSVKHIWGIHLSTSVKKELPEDLKLYLDSSEHGVIYVSFGTNSNPSLLPLERIKIFSDVFSQLPYDVLWKWDRDQVDGLPKNVKVSKWFPQTDLLRHPKIKLFITQGGLQSTDEAISAEVPLLGFPMLGDQWFNTEKYNHLGIGMKLDFHKITEEELRKSIDEVIKNPSYRNNVKRLKKIMEDQPISALEHAVWWTEYVLRHGGAQHLRAPAANMSWSEYLELELVLTLLLVMFTVIVLFVLVVVAIVKYLKKRFGVKIKSQ